MPYENGKMEENMTLADKLKEARKNAGLTELKLDKELLRVARIKSQDMVDNNYFAHTTASFLLLSLPSFT